MLVLLFVVDILPHVSLFASLLSHAWIQTVSLVLPQRVGRPPLRIMVFCAADHERTAGLVPARCVLISRPLIMFPRQEPYPLAHPDLNTPPPVSPAPRAVAMYGFSSMPLACIVCLKIGVAAGMPQPGPNSEEELIQFLFKNPTPEGGRQCQKVRCGMLVDVWFGASTAVPQAATAAAAAAAAAVALVYLG